MLALILFIYVVYMLPIRLLQVCARQLVPWSLQQWNLQTAASLKRQQLRIIAGDSMKISSNKGHARVIFLYDAFHTLKVQWLPTASYL
jgi:hypothetical protein